MCHRCCTDWVYDVLMKDFNVLFHLLYCNINFCQILKSETNENIGTMTRKSPGFGFTPNHYEFELSEQLDVQLKVLLITTAIHVVNYFYNNHIIL